MPVFRAIVFSAALAGLIAGVFVSVAQRFGTVPLIQRAEVYERQSEAATHQHAAAAADEAWEPAEGFERSAWTVVFNILEWIGFGLLLNGAIVLLRRQASWREGFLWGLGAFVVFVIAPGLGLPPELPGIPAADLLARQLWWAATVAATAVGLGLIAFRRSPLAGAIAILLIAAPHLAGAPHLDDIVTNVPEPLSRQFIVAVTITALPGWALLGGLSGHFFRVFARTA